jgi:hypothetical protein
MAVPLSPPPRRRAIPHLDDGHGRKLAPLPLTTKAPPDKRQRLPSPALREVDGGLAFLLPLGFELEVRSLLLLLLTRSTGETDNPPGRRVLGCGWTNCLCVCVCVGGGVEVAPLAQAAPARPPKVEPTAWPRGSEACSATPLADTVERRTETKRGRRRGGTTEIRKLGRQRPGAHSYFKHKPGPPQAQPSVRGGQPLWEYPHKHPTARKLTRTYGVDQCTADACSTGSDTQNTHLPHSDVRSGGHDAVQGYA